MTPFAFAASATDSTMPCALNSRASAGIEPYVTGPVRKNSRPARSEKRWLAWTTIFRPGSPPSVEKTAFSAFAFALICA